MHTYKLSMNPSTLPSLPFLIPPDSIFRHPGFDTVIEMSRHNRRRARNGRETTKTSFQVDSFDLPSFAITSPETKLSNPKYARRNDLSARHWHNRYIAWQARERKQMIERDRLREEQKRIFGGDSQDGEDEDGLCGKMMDFFVAMDYLEG